MKILHADSMAADDGRLILVTEPNLTKEVFDAFDSVKKAHPLYKDVKCELDDGRIAIVGPFDDHFGEFLAQELNAAVSAVAHHRQMRKEQEDRQRLQRRNSVAESARRLGLGLK